MNTYELKQHRALVGQPPIEDALLRHVDGGNTVLFVRLECSKKRVLSEHQESSTEFIDENSSESYDEFERLIVSRSFDTRGLKA